jgi:hypothetical protein
VRTFATDKILLFSSEGTSEKLYYIHNLSDWQFDIPLKYQIFALAARRGAVDIASASEAEDPD